MFLTIHKTMTLFDFTKNEDLSNWRVVDDVVMGGRSDGNLVINEEGHGVFYGTVSLENYGGFSSIRYQFEQQDVSNFKICKIRLKGDGKSYQFRIKTNRNDRHSYVRSFDTSGEWETIEISLSTLSPTFRGMELNMPNFPAEQMEEIAFLIGNSLYFKIICMQYENFFFRYFSLKKLNNS